MNIVKGAKALGKEGVAAQMARRRAVDAVGQYVAGAVAYNVLMGVGDKVPDVDDPEDLKRFFAAIQALNAERR